MHPNFTAQYTSDTIHSGSIIVACGEKSKILDQSDLYETEISYQTMSQQTTGFDGEGQIASAMSYVTNDDMPILYTLTGHNETEIGTNLTNAVEKANLEIQSLNLISGESVPEDAELLIIAAPKKDLSEEEAKKIINYLENGGNLLLFSYFTSDEMPNFDSILASYGLKRDRGLILEEMGNIIIRSFLII